MDSPWLKIPYDDYESHMSSPGVGQLQVLSALFGAVMDEYDPPSLAVLGCGAGNGFEHLRTGGTRRVAAVDINSEYLAELHRRHARRLPGLEIIECDVESDRLPALLNGGIARGTPHGIDLIFAALIFEYVNVRKAVTNIARSLVAGGVLIAALQIPSPDSSPVTPTRFKSLGALSSVMKLVEPVDLDRVCGENGLVRVKERLIPLEHGKKLWVGSYENTNREASRPTA